MITLNKQLASLSIPRAKTCFFIMLLLTFSFPAINSADVLPPNKGIERIVTIFAQLCDPNVEIHEAIKTSKLNFNPMERELIESFVEPSKEYKELVGWSFQDFGEDYKLVSSASIPSESVKAIYTGIEAEYSCILLLPPQFNTTGLADVLTSDIGIKPTQEEVLESYQRSTWEHIGDTFVAVFDFYAATQPDVNSILSWVYLDSAPLQAISNDGIAQEHVKPVQQLSSNQPANPISASLEDSMGPPKTGAMLPASFPNHQFDCSSPFKSLKLTDDGQYSFSFVNDESISERYSTSGASLVFHDAARGLTSNEVSSSGQLIHRLSFNLDNDTVVTCHLSSHEVGDLNPSSQFQACNTGDRRNAYIQQISIEGQSRRAIYKAAGVGVRTSEYGYSVFDAATKKLAVFFPDLGHRTGTASSRCPTEGTLCEFWSPRRCVPK